MNTENNQPTRSTPEPHPESTGRDNDLKQKFRVKLHWTQLSTAIVILKADSVEQAEELADKIDMEAIEEWQPCDGDMYVQSVELMEEGLNND